MLMIHDRECHPSALAWIRIPLPFLPWCIIYSSVAKRSVMGPDDLTALTKQVHDNANTYFHRYSIALCANGNGADGVQRYDMLTAGEENQAIEFYSWGQHANIPSSPSSFLASSFQFPSTGYSFAPHYLGISRPSPQGHGRWRYPVPIIYQFGKSFELDCAFPREPAVTRSHLSSILPKLPKLPILLPASSLYQTAGFH